MHDVAAIQILRQRTDRAARAAETKAMHAAAARSRCARAGGFRRLLGGCERPDRRC
jgi:hypothetical protein